MEIKYSIMKTQNLKIYWGKHNIKMIILMRLKNKKIKINQSRHRPFLISKFRKVNIMLTKENQRTTLIT